MFHSTTLYIVPTLRSKRVVLFQVAFWQLRALLLFLVVPSVVDLYVLDCERGMADNGSNGRSTNMQVLETCADHRDNPVSKVLDASSLLFDEKLLVQQFLGSYPDVKTNIKRINKK